MKGNTISSSIDSISSDAAQWRGQQIDALLQKAAGERAQISLYERDQLCWPWLTGQLVKADSQTIELIIVTHPGEDLNTKKHNSSIAKLYCDEHIYQFETRMKSPLILGLVDGTLARLSCPDTVEVCERRRFPRRALRQQSMVHIRPSSDNNTCSTGVMLNVSSAGLACRLSTDDASILQPDMQVGVIFSLDDSASQFRLAGRVVNRSEAGTPGQSIVGIEFDDPANEALKAKIAYDINAKRVENLGTD